MNYKDKLEVTRITTSIVLLFTAIFGMVNPSDGWQWFLLAGAFMYPKYITVEFRE